MKMYIKKLIKILLKYVPTNKSWIVFESHSDFCDNSRALFEYMYEREMYKKYKFIWLVDNKDNFKDKYYKNTKFINIKPRRIDEKIYLYLYGIFSRYAIFSHRPIGGFSKFQVRINLWHGTILKNIRGKVPEGNAFDYILVPNEFYKDIYIDQFKCEENQLIYLGYPRNDMLFNNSKHIKKIIQEEDYDKFVIWMPTFRQHKNGNRVDSSLSMKYGVPMIEDENQLKELDEYLKNIDTYILIKPHPAQDLSTLNEFNLSNIKIITNKFLDKNNIELYSLVGEADALITDYSSIYFDYLILDKPIGFVINDSEEYKNNIGYVFENPLEFMPGMKINELEGLKIFLENIKTKDEYKKQRNLVNKKVNLFFDNNNCKRIVEYFKM